MENNELFWLHMVGAAGSIRKVLDDKPDEYKAKVRSNPGSILNAYREGDLNFCDAVDMLNKWKSESTDTKSGDNDIFRCNS